MDCGIDQDPVTNDPLQGAYKSDPAAKPTTLVPKGLMTLQPCSTEATICPVGVDRIAMEYDDLAMGTVPPFKALCFSASGWSMREGTTSTRLKISKVVVVGDLYVGKTSLINRFCKDVFDRDYKATIGVDFEIERFEIAGVPYNLQIWDTAGQEKFKCIASAYYRGAEVVITVFDLADVQTLDHTKWDLLDVEFLSVLLLYRQWLEDALKENEPGSSFIFLVGTKKDLVSEASCEQIELDAIRLANEMQAEYWSVSAKTGENIKDFFCRVAALAFEKSMLMELEKNQGRMAQIGAGNLIKIEGSSLEASEASSPANPSCC